MPDIKPGGIINTTSVNLDNPPLLAYATTKPANPQLYGRSSSDAGPLTPGWAERPKIARTPRGDDQAPVSSLLPLVGGGDPQASMFFGFKPNTMWSKLDVIPKSVLKAIEKVIFSDEEALMNHSSIALADDPSSLTADVIRAGMLPRGSALITSAGALEATGIKAIIHAATGSMRLGGGVFEPTLTSVASSVKASLELARAGGHRRVAIPFIGGGIFVERLGVTPQALADLIVTTAIQESNGLELRFVTFGEIDTQLFKNALQKNKSPENAQVVSGSLTDFKIHGASAIVNAANTEAQFGGGVSGVIGRATGRIEEINREAQLKISAWLQSLQLQIKIRAHNQ